jgi:hypothetical protein
MDSLSQKQKQQFLSYNGFPTAHTNSNVYEINLQVCKQNNLDNDTKSNGLTNLEISQTPIKNQENTWCSIS